MGEGCEREEREGWLWEGKGGGEGACHFAKGGGCPALGEPPVRNAIGAVEGGAPIPC